MTLTPHSILNNAYTGLVQQGHIHRHTYTDPSTGCHCAVGFSWQPEDPNHNQTSLFAVFPHDDPNFEILEMLQEWNDDTTMTLPKLLEHIELLADTHNVELTK